MKFWGMMANMKQFKLEIFLLLMILLTAAPVAGGADFTTRNRQVYEVRQQVRLTKVGGSVENLKLEVPVFLRDNLPPYQRIIAFSANMSSLKIIPSETEPLAVYCLSRWQGQRELLLEFNYTIENKAIDYRLPKYAGGNEVDRRYLLPEPEIESAAKPIVDLATELSAKEPYPLDKAVKLFDYVNAKIQYQFNDATAHSALRTLRRGTGDCEDFSLLYIALCRAAGLPARFVNGFRFDPTTLKIKDSSDLNQCGHAWVEINLPGIGWIPVEPTYIYSVNGVRQVNYDFFGKLRDDDRHLLFNYSHDGSARCSWSRYQQVLVQVKMDNRMTIRRIK
jgi:hypothetical protein